MEQLTARQQNILGILVREYIATAKPIGSDMIIQRHNLGVSSATVRNEFARLTEMGYLAQPHTSAGRVPTEKSYRYSVERLMEASELPVSERLLIRHQFHQISLDLDEWMKLAASVLARIVHSAALVAAPQARQVRFRHVHFVSISELTGLMILVLQDSSVHQQMMLFAQPVGQEQLTRLSNKINDQFASSGVEQVRALAQDERGPEQGSLESEITERILTLMDSYAAQQGRQIHRDGLTNILHQPEFVEIERTRHMVQVWERDSALETIFDNVRLANGVQVIFGSQDEMEGIRDCSMILSQYGLPGEANGVLGVLGPMRMTYARAIPAVRYVASLMSDLVHRLYGE